MPYFRHRSFVFAPASASLSTPMICSSVNRRLFIRLLPDEQTLLHSWTNLGEQTTRSPAASPAPAGPASVEASSRSASSSVRLSAGQTRDTGVDYANVRSDSSFLQLSGSLAARKRVNPPRAFRPVRKPCLSLVAEHLPATERTKAKAG